MARYADIDVLLEHLTTSDEGNFRTAITQWLEMHQVEDVAPVIHAHWRYMHRSKSFGLFVGACSNCGSPNIVADYCGNCGAKMDKEE